MATRPTKPSASEIYEALRRQILSLALEPGISLDEFSLADKFGVSRSPIRSAVARLSAEGLVETIGNRIRVSQLMGYKAFPQYVDALDLAQRAVTRLAAREATAADIHTIHDASDTYLEAVQDSNPDVMFRANKSFHLVIAEVARNSFLSQYYKTLLDENQRLLHLQFDFLATEFGQSLGNDHEDIMRAIAENDEHAAEAAAHEHTLLFRDRFLHYLKKQRTDTIELDFQSTREGAHNE